MQDLLDDAILSWPEFASCFDAATPSQRQADLYEQYVSQRRQELAAARGLLGGSASDDVVAAQRRAVGDAAQQLERDKKQLVAHASTLLSEARSVVAFSSLHFSDLLADVQQPL